MELNQKDTQIISILDKNSRTSVSEIARKLRLSKDGVNYRLKRLQEKEIITRYFAEIDISRIGIIAGKVTLQLQNVDKKKENEIFNYLKKYPKIGWVVSCSGRWDCVFVFYVKDNYEIKEMITNIVEEYGKYILSKEVVLIPEYYILSRGWLNNNKDKNISKIGGKISTVVDTLDIKLIKILTKNCREPIIDIANELNQSSSLIILRIKKLEEKGVIKNYNISLNLNKLKKEFCKSFIYLQNYTREEYEKLREYCLSYPNVTALTNTVGAWEMEIEMEVNNFSEFYEIMNEIKNKFNLIIKNYEAITITKEYGRDYSTII